MVTLLVPLLTRIPSHLLALSQTLLRHCHTREKMFNKVVVMVGAGRCPLHMGCSSSRSWLCARPYSLSMCPTLTHLLHRPLGSRCGYALAGSGGFTTTCRCRLSSCLCLYVCVCLCVCVSVCLCVSVSLYISMSLTSLCLYSLEKNGQAVDATSAPGTPAGERRPRRRRRRRHRRPRWAWRLVVAHVLLAGLCSTAVTAAGVWRR